MRAQVELEMLPISIQPTIWDQQIIFQQSEMYQKVMKIGIKKNNNHKTNRNNNLKTKRNNNHKIKRNHNLKT